MGKNENSCDCNVVHEEAIEHVQQEIVSEDEMDKMSKLYKIFGDSHETAYSGGAELP